MLQIYYPVTLMMCFLGAFQCDNHASDILGKRKNSKKGASEEFTFIFLSLAV